MRIGKKDLEAIIEKYKKKTAKKCYKINLMEGDDDNEVPNFLDNKLGGKPYLPVGEAYPTDKNGRPMPLLMQINLKDIDLKDFPKQGILEIFTNMDYPLEYCVKLFDEGLEYQTDLPEAKIYYEGAEQEYFIKKPLFVMLEKTTTHMPTDDYRCYRTLKKIMKEQLQDKVTEEEINECFKDYTKLCKVILDKLHYALDHALFSIGGYPAFAQYDPRPDLKPKKNECVFSFDPIGYEEYIEIGDSGTMWGFISKEELKNGKLDQMFVDYDCC